MVFDVEKMRELVGVAEVDSKRDAIAIGRAPKRTAVAPFGFRCFDGRNKFGKMIREKYIVVLSVRDVAAPRPPQYDPGRFTIEWRSGQRLLLTTDQGTMCAAASAVPREVEGVGRIIGIHIEVGIFDE